MIRSAMAFLPDSMITFMNLDRSTEPNFGSGRMSRLGTSRRRGISLFLLLQLARAFAVASGTTDIWGCPLTRTSGIACPICPRPLSLLRTLGAVLGARLLAVFHALQVERATHDVVAHAGQVFHATAAHQHDAVLLQVVAFAADVRNDLEAVGQTNFGHFAQRRVRLLRSRRVHASANATALASTLPRWRFGPHGLGH